MVLRVRTKADHHSVVRQEKGSRRTCAKRQVRNSTDLKTLITSACLKHSDFLKIDNWIDMCLTAVHMKPFSMIERVRRFGIDQLMSNCCCEVSLTKTIETREINTPLQTQRRSSVRISRPCTTHPDDSDTIRQGRHPCPSLKHTYTRASRRSSRIRHHFQIMGRCRCNTERDN